MAKKTSGYKKFITRDNVLIGVVVFLLLFIVSVIAGRFILSRNEDELISKDQIMIQKGGSTIIVNKNGLVEYRSGNEVFYRTWDSSKISYFFNRMETKAREYLEEGLTGQCISCQGENCYTVTLYVDDQLVAICVTDDEDINEAFEEFGDSDNFEGVDLGDFFDNDEQDGNGVSSGQISPTPTPLFGSDSPTPTQTQDEEDQQHTNYPPVEAGCSSWTQDIVDKAVITNTLCTIEEQ